MAFPQPQTVTDGRVSHACDYGHGGMYLRDWFAGQALAAVIEVYRFDNGASIGTDHLPRNVAAHAYRIADAMLAERAKAR